MYFDENRKLRPDVERVDSEIAEVEVTGTGLIVVRIATVATVVAAVVARIVASVVAAVRVAAVISAVMLLGGHIGSLFRSLSNSHQHTAGHQQEGSDSLPSN
jgi:hypothetical protein